MTSTEAERINFSLHSVVFHPWQILLLAAILALTAFAVQGRQGINLGDEGFLWYGVQQTARGKIPLRDFQSYDPGRYYWGAMWTFLFGNGLVALRFSQTLFQIFGLCMGLLAASRVASNWGLLIGIGLMLTVWMFPLHKLIDATLLLCGIWIAVRLLEEPSRDRIFMAGFFVGLCVFFGRNHALYNFLAEGCLLLFLRFKLRLELPISYLGMWVAGITVGLVPTIAMLIGAPGFFASYIESFQLIFRRGANLALPVPWPWLVSPNSPGAANQFLLGIFLVILPCSYIAAIIFALAMPLQLVKDYSLFIACAFIGLFYLHHAFARADFSHLAQVIHPFTLAVVAFASARGGRTFYSWAVVALLIVAALFTVGRQTPIYQRLTSRTSWVPCEIGGKIFVPQSINRVLVCLQKFAADNIDARDNVLIAPFTPILYPILKHDSPLWDLAYYFPATRLRQEAMIQELMARQVDWAIISEIPLDKRQDLRFSATHPLVWQHLRDNFEPVETACLPQSTKILRRKSFRSSGH